LESIARTRDIELKSGSLTLNEARSLTGRPLIEAPEADMPIVAVGNGAYLVTEDGFKPLETPVEGGGELLGEEQGGSPEPTTPELEAVQDTVQAESERDQIDEGKAAQEELKQFLRWLRKSPDRSFRFKEVPVVYADVLNKFVATKDYDSARWYAERYLA
jgi:hypothetical protein